ncbi:unannotated protein [freshwater metagenome]|uniref:Unannotated protein n=1 Tax=freshwater metagenome TaxID=449393 RepID=A0A6J7F032_9ZZZZ
MAKPLRHRLKDRVEPLQDGLRAEQRTGRHRCHGNRCRRNACCCLGRDEFAERRSGDARHDHDHDEPNEGPGPDHDALHRHEPSQRKVGLRQPRMNLGPPPKSPILSPGYPESIHRAKGLNEAAVRRSTGRDPRDHEPGPTPDEPEVDGDLHREERGYSREQWTRRRCDRGQAAEYRDRVEKPGNGRIGHLPGGRDHRRGLRHAVAEGVTVVPR